MANIIQTNEGVGENDELSVWINNHNLGKARTQLLENEITLQELVELSDKSIKELQEFGKTELGLNLIISLRFAKAVKGLSSSQQIAASTQQQQQQQPIKEIVRIVMSKEEGDAIDRITKAEQDINQRIKVNMDKINTLKQMAISNEERINKFGQEMKKKLDQRMAQLIQKSNQEIGNKQNVLSQHVKKLQQQQVALNKANSDADNLLQDTTINAGKRKSKIVKIADNALKIGIKEANITPKVTVSLDENAVISFIAKIGKVTNFTYPEAPILSIHDIKESSASIILNNMKSSYQCKVEVAQNYSVNNDGDNDDDEKKMEWKEEKSSIINGNKYIVSNLKHNTNYGIRAHYKNKYGFGPKSNIYSFKTKKMEMVIESQILTLQEKNKLNEMVNNHTNNQYKKQWVSLYRASRDGFTVNGFYNKCNDKNNTLCIIQTEHNNVFGGFTSLKWMKSKTESTSNEGDNKAFIYLIRSQKGLKAEIFPVQNNGNNAIQYQKYYYLIFGKRGYGFALQDQCNTSTSSIASGSQCPEYNVNRYTLNGNNYSFKVAEIEVFELKRR